MRPIILLKPRQALPVGGEIKGRPLAGPDIAMETSLLGVVGAETPGGMIAENQGESPAVAIARGLEEALPSRDRAGARGRRRFASRPPLVQDVIALVGQGD